MIVAVRIFKLVLDLLVTTGCVRAALGFSRGEHLRRAWLLMALDYAALAVAQMVVFLAPSVVVRLAITVVVNGFGVAATVYFARAHKLAGLELPGLRGWIYLFTALLALVLVGVPFLDTLRNVQSGNLGVLIVTVSSIGDLATFTLVGPIFLTALAFRGGLLVWPWAFLVASNAAWFLQDAGPVADILWRGVSEDSVFLWTNLWQVLACFLALAAAVAQRRVVHHGE